MTKRKKEKKKDTIREIELLAHNRPRNACFGDIYQNVYYYRGCKTPPRLHYSAQNVKITIILLYESNKRFRFLLVFILYKKNLYVLDLC